MSEITFTLAALNLARLYADLAATFTGRVVGIGSVGDRVTIYILGDATEAERAALEVILAAHDPDARTPDQEADAAGRADLAGMLADIATQRAALQDALGRWAALTQAEQIAVLKRDTAIIDKTLGVFAYLLRHWPL